MSTAKKSTASRLPRLKMWDLVAIFGVSHMSILNWKQPKDGVEHRKTPLPFHKDADGHVTYTAPAIVAWAKKNGVETVKDPIKYAEHIAKTGEHAAAKKPGPKPKAKAAKKKAPAKTAAATKKKAKKVDVEARAKTEKARDAKRIESKQRTRKAPAKKVEAAAVEADKPQAATRRRA